MSPPKSKSRRRERGISAGGNGPGEGGAAASASPRAARPSPSSAPARAETEVRIWRKRLFAIPGVKTAGAEKVCLLEWVLSQSKVHRQGRGCFVFVCLFSFFKLDVQV